MTWLPNNPNSTDKILDIPGILENNFAAIDQAVSKEHQPLSGTPLSGKHIPGLVGVIDRDISSSFALLSSPSTGAMAWATDLGLLYTYSGSSWVNPSSQKWSRVRAYLATLNMYISGGNPPINLGFNGLTYDTLSEFTTGASTPSSANAASFFTASQSGFYLITSTISVQGSGAQPINAVGNPSSDVTCGWKTTPVTAGTTHFSCVDAYPLTADAAFVTACSAIVPSGTYFVEDHYLVGAAVLSGTQYRNPNANILNQWRKYGSITNGNSSYIYVNKYPTYNDSTFNLTPTSTTVSSADSFGFSNFSLPVSSTNIVLTMSIRIKEAFISSDSISGSVTTLGGSQFYTPTIPLSSSWTVYTYSWSSNPMTSLAWTVNDINGIGTNSIAQFGYIGKIQSQYYSVQISDINLQVSYSYPLGTTLPIPANSTVSNIQVTYRIRSRGASGSDYCVIQPEISVYDSGVNHVCPGSGVLLTPGTSAFTNYTYSWPYNPAFFYGVPWTAASASAVTGVGMFFWNTNSTGISADCSMIYLTVNWYPPRSIFKTNLIKNVNSAPTSAILATSLKPIQEAGFPSGQTSKITTVTQLACGDKINIQCSKTLLDDEVMGDPVGQNSFICIHRLSGLGGL